MVAKLETRQQCTLRLFGSMTLEGTDYRLNRFETKRSALILARVALARDQRIGRDELAEMLWPDEYLEQTRLRLRQELLRLRNVLGPYANRLQSDRHCVELQPGFLEVDVRLFETAVRDAGLTNDVEEHIRLLEAAVSLVSGPFLAGYQEPWVQASRRTYSEKVKSTWLELAEAYDSGCHFDKAIDATSEAIALEPLDVSANTCLIQRLVSRGQTAAARQALESFDALMARELGCRAPASVGACLPQPANSVGVVRPSPIFGREELIDKIEAALSRPGSCVVLTGMPGIGKTHLLQEVAWRFSRDHDLAVQVDGAPHKVSDGLIVIGSGDPEKIAEARALGWRVLSESRVKLEIAGCDQIPVPMLGDEAVQLLSPAGCSACELDRLAEIAGRTGRHPLALRYFADRLAVSSAGQIIEGFDAEMGRFLQESSLLTALQAVILGTPQSAAAALQRLAVIGEAESGLANRLATVKDDSGVWRTLENRGLVSVSSVNGTRRILVPVVVQLVLRSTTDEAEALAIRIEVLRAFANWAYEQSRVVLGPLQDEGFAALSAELPSVRAAMAWAIGQNPALAAYFVVGSWRTFSARGLPYPDGDLAYAAAKAGAHLLEPIFGGEAWTGAGITLAVTRRIEQANHCYEEGIRVFDSDPSLGDKAAWAKMNYASCLSHLDKPRAQAMLKEAVDQAQREDLKQHGQTDYALMLASVGILDESIQLAEDIFAKRLASNNGTKQARAYVDLGELYQIVGRTEAARPLTMEGIRRLREGGVQYMLIDQLIYLANIVVADAEVDWELLRELIEEAESIAGRIGGTGLRLDVARLRLTYASRQSDRAALIQAVEELFELSKDMQNLAAKAASLRLLAGELDYHGRHDYANAVLSSMDGVVRTPCQDGWLGLLQTENHVAGCVLAVMLAKEAF